ncbi:MAG: hypothetical protein ABR915_00115 [Thermoguttaceae bacterium]
MSKALSLATLILIGGRALGEPPADPVSREQAMKATLAAIDQELKDHGGSFENWGNSIKPYRDAVRKVLATEKWPWPAKSNFAFQGAEVNLLMLDTLEGQSKRAVDVILDTHKKLKAEGIDLIFVPLPDKLQIYPDYLSDAAPADRMVAPAVKHLMKKLLENDVECVDLYPAFHAFRKRNEDKPLYYDRDSHWNNLAAQIAGEQIAGRLLRYDFVKKAMAEEKRYSTKPEYRRDKPDQLLVVLDARTGGRYADAGNSPILITGDSALMMNLPPRSAHMPAHIGLHINMPLAFGSNTIPPEHFGKLSGKRVVIWANMARMLPTCGWPTRSKTK